MCGAAMLDLIEGRWRQGGGVGVGGADFFAATAASAASSIDFFFSSLLSGWLALPIFCHDQVFVCPFLHATEAWPLLHAFFLSVFVLMLLSRIFVPASTTAGTGQRFK